MDGPRSPKSEKCENPNVGEIQKEFPGIKQNMPNDENLPWKNLRAMKKTDQNQ